MGLMIPLAGSWAQEEFGAAALGDKRRTDRLLRMGEHLATTHGGAVSSVFTVSAEKEAAYRFIENDAIGAAPIIASSAAAAFTRAIAAKCTYVIAPVDQSSLSLPNGTADAGFGPVGRSTSITFGLESMNAILVTPEGVPLGVAGQKFWSRKSGPKKKKARTGKRSLGEMELANWLDVSEQALRAWRAAGPTAPRPWFQFDRGADARDILVWAALQDVWVTVRAAQDRRVEWPEDGLLWNVVSKQKSSGTFNLKVPASPSRKARTATLEVRFSPVVFPLRNPWTKAESPVELYVVHAKEVSNTAGAEPIEWMLITNRSVLDLDMALTTIQSYALRWRIEEVHRSWKSTCRVETSALQEANHFEIWAALLFAVAVRIERLKRLARINGHEPASQEFTAWELKALILLRQPKGLSITQVPTQAQAIRWIAELGGYIGSSSRAPPGAVTLARGLLKLASAAEAIERFAAEMQK